MACRGAQSRFPVFRQTVGCPDREPELSGVAPGPVPQTTAWRRRIDQPRHGAWYPAARDRPYRGQLRQGRQARRPPSPPRPNRPASDVNDHQRQGCPPSGRRLQASGADQAKALRRLRLRIRRRPVRSSAPPDRPAAPSQADRQACPQCQTIPRSRVQPPVAVLAHAAAGPPLAERGQPPPAVSILRDRRATGRQPEHQCQADAAVLLWAEP